MKTKKEKKTLAGQIGGICPAGFCNGGFGCNHQSPKPKEKKHKHKWGKKFTNLESKSYYKGCKCGVVLEIPKPKEKKVSKDKQVRNLLTLARNLQIKLNMKKPEKKVRIEEIRNKKLYFKTYDEWDKYCIGKDIQRCHIFIKEHLSEEKYCKRYKALMVNIKTGKIINFL